MTQIQGESDRLVKARQKFFAAEQELIKASEGYQKARADYEQACSQMGMVPHYSAGARDAV